MFWTIFGIIGGLFGIGGVAYAADQRSKRVAEQSFNRATIAALRGRIAEMESRLACLSALLGDKNRQVRELAAEIGALRRELARRLAA
jgi:uncharacterized protein involved in exopolysaccharide biosynthesis